MRGPLTAGVRISRELARAQSRIARDLLSYLPHATLRNIARYLIHHIEVHDEQTFAPAFKPPRLNCQSLVITQSDSRR